MKDLERILKALANKRRLAILRFLKKRQPASVGSIAKEIDLSLKATSKHLSILAAADIVEKEQRSSNVFYRISATQAPAAKHILSLV